MPAHDSSADQDPATEQSPLLSNGHVQADEEASVTAGHSAVEDGNETALPDEPSTGELALIMVGPWIGSFLAAVDSTIIATLTAPISASFNSLSLLSWLASAYFIANAAFQPLSGRLTDILSRRWGLVFCNVMFAAGNLICGLAQKEWVMIFGRVVAGTGGGGLNAISTFLGSDMVPLRRRGIWQGFGNITYGAGAAVGAVLGGWINDVWGWRSAFLMLVPLTAISGGLSFWKVNVPVKQSNKSALKRIDFLGAFTLLVTLVLLLLGINSGGNIVPWNHPLVYVSLPLSALGLLAFNYVELRRASEPVIPVRLLANRTVIAACFTNWFASMAVFSLMYYAPIYFQVKGLSTTQAGLRLAPQAVGTAVGSITVGLVTRKTGRYYYMGVVVMAVFIGANIIATSFNVDSPLWLTIVAIFMAGFGYVGMLTVTLLAFISAVDHEHQAVITSASYAFRSTGSAIGIAISSAVFQNLLKPNLWSAIGDRHNSSEIVDRLRNNLDVIKELSPHFKADVQLAYMESLRGVFVTTLGLSIVASLVSLAMREHKLHTNLARK